jgi:prolyl 4-hydroxylase
MRLNEFIKFKKYQLIYYFIYFLYFIIFIGIIIYLKRLIDVNIREYSFLSSQECNQLIQLGQSRVEESKLYNGTVENSYDETIRKSKNAWISKNENVLIQKIYKNISEITGAPVETMEDLQIAKYDKSGFYLPHYDACDYLYSNCSVMDKEFNNVPRMMTAIIYLNDDFKGGATLFPKLFKKIKPVCGKMLLFNDSYRDGSIIRSSLHGGNIVRDGEKWIASVWIHYKK